MGRKFRVRALVAALAVVGCKSSTAPAGEPIVGTWAFTLGAPAGNGSGGGPAAVTPTSFSVAMAGSAGRYDGLLPTFAESITTWVSLDTEEIRTLSGWVDTTAPTGHLMVYRADTLLGFEVGRVHPLCGALLLLATLNAAGDSAHGWAYPVSTATLETPCDSMPLSGHK